MDSMRAPPTQMRRLRVPEMPPIFLLDWSAGGGDRYDAIKHLVGSDAALDRERARKIYDAHLARAEWMTRTGYRLLLSGE
jgi:hypothetical protein